jgi:uncharacterized membrane protein (UPF0127 family)
MIVYRYNTDKTKTLLFEDIAVADNFFAKLIGLTFKKNLNYGEGLLIRGCSSIHTMWMRFNIDVLFLDISEKAAAGCLRIVELIENMKAFSFSPIVPDSGDVLELKSGAIARNNIKKGELLCFDL